MIIQVVDDEGEGEVTIVMIDRRHLEGIPTIGMREAIDHGEIHVMVYHQIVQGMVATATNDMMNLITMVGQEEAENTAMIDVITMMNKIEIGTAGHPIEANQLLHLMQRARSGSH